MTTNLPALRALYYAEPAVNALIDEVERLRKEAVENGWPEASRQLARALTAEKRLAEAEKVIEPFARSYQRFVYYDDPDEVMGECFRLYAMPLSDRRFRELLDDTHGEPITMDHLRAACVFMKGDQP